MSGQTKQIPESRYRELLAAEQKLDLIRGQVGAKHVLNAPQTALLRIRKILRGFEA